MRETLEAARTALVTAGQAGQPDRRRWPVLGIVGLAQLIIVLELKTVKNRLHLDISVSGGRAFPNEIRASA